MTQKPERKELKLKLLEEQQRFNITLLQLNTRVRL